MKREESNTQINCVTWFRLQYPQYRKVLFSVPNGGMRPRKTKTLRDGRVISYSPEGQKLKEEGQTEGVSDLILLISRKGFGALCLEMKRQKGGKQSPEQKEWQEAAEAAGNRYVVCKTIEEFIRTINWYLS